MSQKNIRKIGIIMNGVTGRMGLNQHLVRSILAIREQGGVPLSGNDVAMPEVLLIGRNAGKLEGIASKYGGLKWSTDLDAPLRDPS
jgi:predicted dehydrogenase